jgi:hypothetical protein
MHDWHGPLRNQWQNAGHTKETMDERDADTQAGPFKRGEGGAHQKALARILVNDVQ